MPTLVPTLVPPLVPPLVPTLDPPAAAAVALAADDVTQREVQQVYERLRMSALLSIGVALIFVGPMLPLFERAWGLAWFGVLLVTQFGRLVLAWRYARTPSAPAQAGRWRFAFALAAGLSGLSWAFGPCLLLAPGDSERGAVLAVAMLAVAAVAVTQLAAQWSALAAFLTCALVPSAIALLRLGGDVASLLAGVVAAAWLMLLVVGRGSNRSNAARIRAEVELARALAAARSLAADLQQASQQLRYESERLAHLLAATNAASAEWDLRSGRVQLNERGVALLGLASAGAEGMGIAALAELIHADDRPEARHQVRRHLAGRRPDFEFEARLRHRDGHWIWTRVTGRAATSHTDGPDRRATMVIATFIDLSEPKAKERRWRSRAELSADWFWETDAEHRIALLSDGIRDGLPIAHDRLLGRRLTEVAELLPADSGWAPLTDRLVNQELFTGFVCRLLAPDGRESFIELDGRPRHADDGRFLGYEGVGRDITARRRATEALRESLALVDALFETMAVPVVLKDTAGRIVRVNRAFHEMAGDGPDGRARSGAFDDVVAMAQHEAVDRDLLTRPGRRIYELRQRMSDGRAIDMLVHKCTLVAADGTVTGLVGTVVDISEQKRAAEALAGAKEAAEQANRAKSSFLATMSHELRTPLNAVIGAAQLLRTAASDERSRAALVDTIETSGSALLGLIENVMDLSRIEAGALALAPEDFDLLECVEAAVATIAMPARAKGLALACIVEPDVPAWRRGDPLRLRQVLLNLLGNAVKFTSAGEVVLRLARGAGDDGELLIEVHDSGIGIAAPALAHVFEPFRQADSGTTRRFGGSGLGLAIVKQLVQAMGGQIGVRSAIGRGTTFTITLPLPPAREAPADLPALGHAVAYFEPHEASARALAALLLRLGCRAERCTTAAEAAQWARRHGAAGWLLLATQAAGAEEIAHAVADTVAPGRVIGLTERPSFADGSVREAAGLRRHLAKPVLRAKLVSAVARHSAEGDPAPAAGAGAAATPAADTGARAQHRVLVVEDDATNRQIVGGMLRHAGYAVGTAVDGGQALRLLGERDWDLVLMDWQMPDMDGLEVTRRLRQGACGERGRRVPIVALTANAFAEDRSACLAAGMNDFLTKPVHLASLAATVARWCGSEVQGPLPAPLPHAADARPAVPTAIERPVEMRRAPVPATGAAPAVPPPTATPLDSAPDFDATVLARLPMVADGSDPHYADEVLAGFLQRAPLLLADMHEAQRCGDSRRLVRAAHTLKSASASVGALALARRCASLEAALRGGAAADATALLALDEAFARLRAAMPPPHATPRARTPLPDPVAV